jgi:heat shock protein HslJ/predicted nucleic-acid-binding Zn-ribbon protein
MRQRKWQCLRCSGSKCETGEIRVSGGFWSRIRDVQNKKYIVIASMLIGQLAFAGNTQTMITEPENSTYKGIEDTPVTLSNGIWEGPPYVEGAASRPRVGLLEDMQLMGDLNGDGREEAVVFLWQSGGGTGSYLYIAVMQAENGEYKNISTALVGDRVKLRGANIDSGKISLDVLQAGESDAMCCPTQLAKRNWVLKDKQLEEGKMEITGTLSLSTLEGSEWHLTHFDREQPVSENVEVTLSFNEGRISGKSACNRYAAQVSESDEPGGIRIGQSMGTRMACPEQLMEIEHRYLATLSQVTSFSFNSGSLTLSGAKEDGSRFSMVFSPAETKSK